jgi:hypothetical protein
MNAGATHRSLKQTLGLCTGNLAGPYLNDFWVHTKNPKQTIGLCTGILTGPYPDDFWDHTQKP